jgi:uncharacterized protein (TIGR02757 family)
MSLSPRESMLQDRLEELYRSYGPETMSSDPIVFLSRYESDEDREVVGWIASAFAYGRVETIQDNVGRILEPLGRHPAQTLDRIADFSEFARENLPGFRHRFHGAQDAALLLFVIAHARSKAGSVRRFFEEAFRPEERDTGGLLSRVVARITAFDFRPILRRRRIPPGSPAHFFFPDPARGSACKRWNLYLRWMVRRDRLDYGLWPGIPTDRLVMPTDTHIHLVSRRLGLTRRKSADWKTAREITDRLARFDPADPVRFDYALCRIGIFGICRTDLARSRCMDCLAAVCCPAGMRKITNLSQRRLSRRSNVESPRKLPAQPSTFDLRPSTSPA